MKLEPRSIVVSSAGKTGDGSGVKSTTTARYPILGLAKKIKKRKKPQASSNKRLDNRYKII